MPNQVIRYIYQWTFECPDPKCSEGMVVCFESSDQRQDNLLETPPEGRCPWCSWHGHIDVQKAILRIVEQEIDGKWSTLRILDNQGEWTQDRMA